ncbi:MAG: hypothetical protein IPL49_13615 [Saprospirales bacterium]|nr:hypothetical protein [Saprospirales bacterium]
MRASFSVSIGVLAIALVGEAFQVVVFQVAHAVAEGGEENAGLPASGRSGLPKSRDG